jgi:hypothetical protein
VALEMSDEVSTIAVAGIRHRHPDWTDARIRDETRARLHDPDGRITPGAE